MELILLENIKSLGKLGEVVNVKPGYGRNFLVPQGKAVRATKNNMAEFEKRREELEQRAAEHNAAASARREAVDGQLITIKANASSEGKLYGSVGPREIAEALTAIGKQVDKSEIIMGEGPIRTTGEFEVQLHLAADVDGSVKVVVIEEEEETT